MRMRYLVALTILGAFPLGAQEPTAAGGAVLEERDRLIRERYEQVLANDPLQEAAFDRVYESYMLTEGVDAWLEKLKPAEGAAETVGGLVLRGRILARQFKASEAVETLSKARELGEASPAFNALLGRLYYETGKDTDAIALLGAALDATESPEQRSAICRMLGSVYLRSGQRAEAAAVWERIAELNPNDLFALQELAEIYEENRLWDEAIAARQRIVAAAANDPYRQCHAWRAIGQSLLAKDDHAGAIAAYEQGLALAAPGNWLFEDLKNRLVGVYESRGDLEGLSAYLEARIAQDTTDLSLSELLADVTMRRGDLVKAEALLKDIVARSPGRESALEMLIGLYRQAGRPEDLAATFEVLIAQYPNEPDYLRRLGEAWLEQKSPEKAKETWRRVVGDGTKASNHALLAEWLERSEFFPEASAAYEAALAIQPDREWRLRVASLKYDMGEEEAALAAWQAAVAAEDTPAGEVAEIAAILLSKEFKTEAEALYARAMVLEPENLDHVLAYARLLSGRADHAGAVTQYTRLAEQDTSEYLKNEGERGLLDAYEALGTLDAQRTAWEEAIAQAPDDTVARLKLARLYARLGNRPGVVKLYEECVAIDPARIDFQRLLATAYKENRQTDKAVASLEGLMEKDAGRAQAYLRDLLALYGTAGRGQEAIRSAEKLVELSPASPEARTALAQAYLRNGEPEKGLQQYRDLVQLDGTQPAYFRDFGDALQGQGKFGEAQEIYRKMLDAASDDTTRLDAVNRLAAVYVRNGQRDAILSEFQRRVSAAPKSLEAYQELAAVHRAFGDMQGALETLERAKVEVEDRDAVLRLLMAEAFQAGDNLKVVAVFEELLARSAQPTPHDLDRLAGAYAQVGRMDEALALWDRIAKESPDDAAVQLMVARQLEQFGFYDESNVCTERALEIDPYDHALRFDYAQRLLGFNEVDKALAQMKAILDIGERPEAPQGSAPAASSVVAQPGSFPPNMGMSPRSFRGNFGGGSRWYGQSFGELRQQVVQSMVHLSRQYEEGEPLIDTYRKRIDEQPQNIDARRDYLLVCEASEDHERALEAAKELLVLQPEDDSLRWRIFGYLQQLGRADEAIAVAIELAASPNEQLARQAQLMRIRLLAENSRFEEAEAVLAEMTSDQPEMAQIYLQVASSFQNATDPAIADTFYQRAAELDPRFRHQATTGRARLLQERGDTAAARDLYIEAVFEPAVVDPNNPVVQNPGNNPMPLYMPQGGRRNRQPGGNVTQLQGFNHPALDHQRAEALNQAFRLATEPEAFAPVIARLREEAAKYVTAENDAQRQVASNFVFFLVTSLRSTDQDGEALGAVEGLLAGRPSDSFLQNLRLFLLDDQGQLDAMKAVYAEVEASNPAAAGDVARARLQIALVQEDAAALPALYRALPDTTGGAPTRNRVGIRASQLNQVVRALENAGAKAEARALLEEELARSREYRVLALLVRSLGEAGEHDQAIAYAREAWEKQGSARSHGSNLHYSMDGMTLQTQGLHGLEMLWNAYRLAGRESELVAEFEGRIEGQPTSVTLRQSLVGLYMESRQYDLARAQMEKLLELRPNDVQLKVRYAGLLESNNDPAGALAVLESVAAGRPSAARGISGEIRRLYKDLGKKEELAALDEQLIREARSSEQLQSLARQLAEERDFAKAAELMQKALRIEPENNWLQTQVGDYLWQADQKNEAVDAYFKFLQPATPRQVIYIDAAQMPQIIQRVADAGRLEELKAIAAGTAPNEFSERALKILGALIARHEKRPEDAEAILKSVAEGGGDQQVFALLADLAEARNDPAAAIQYLESVNPTGGTPDFRRIAMLHLKTGDTDKSIQSWKKFAEQQGGYYGYQDAIRSFAEAGEDEVLARFFREVYPSIPESDHARQQLAEALIAANESSGRYDALIEEVVFAEDSKDIGELAQRYIGYDDALPGLTLRRIAPIAARFPDNRMLQGLHADALERSGDIEGALAVYGRLPRDEGFDQELGNRYAHLARSSGNFGPWRDYVLARVERPNPEVGDLNDATLALIQSGRRAELPSLWERALANADEARSVELRAGLARFTADYGDMRGGLAAMKALAEETGHPEMWVRYAEMLLDKNYYKEAARLYTQMSPENQQRFLKQSDPRRLIRAMLIDGQTEGAWNNLVALIRIQRAGEESSGRRAQRDFRALEAFSDFGVTAREMGGFLDTIRNQETLSLADRLMVAGTEIQLGRWAAARAAFQDNEADPAFRALLDYWSEAIPQVLQSETIGGGFRSHSQSHDYGDGWGGGAVHGNREVPENEIRIQEAESMLDDKNAAEVIAALDAIILDESAIDLRGRRAAVYERAGALDKALADLEFLILARPEQQAVQIQRATLLVKKDRLTEAMDAWRASGVRTFPLVLPFLEALVAKGQNQEAEGLLREVGPAGRHARELAILRAKILISRGDVAAVVEVLEPAFSDLNAHGKDSLVQEFGTMLQAADLWRAVLADESLCARPLVIRSLVQLARQYSGEDVEALRSAVATAIPREAVATQADALALAGLLSDLNRREEAIAVLNAGAALPPEPNMADLQILNALVNLEAGDDVARIVIAWSRERPQILNQYESSQAFDQVTDPALREALIDRNIEVAFFDAQEAYLRALKTWYGPDRAAGTAALGAILQAPDAAGEHVEKAASLLRDAGETPLARQGFERLSSGEFGNYYRDTSILSLVSIEKDAGNFGGLLDLFIRLQAPNREDLRRVWRQLVEVGRPMEIETAEPLIRARIEAAPGSPRVSELIALRASLASDKGVVLPPLDLAQLGVPEKERYEAQLWSNLVNSWAMRPPASIRSWNEFAAPLDNDLQSWLRGESLPSTFFEGWLTLWAREVGPTVRFMSEDWGEVWNSPENWASDVLTEIESPDDRTITLAFGSTGWTRIWVNENEVFKNAVERLYFPDSDQFEVPLKKGRNRVVVKEHVDDDDTVFSLSIIAGAEGLKVCAPELPGAPIEAYPEWARKE